MGEKPEKWVQDERVSFSERNIARWTGAFGIRSTVRGDNVERLLERRDEKGNVIFPLARCRRRRLQKEDSASFLFEHKKCGKPGSSDCSIGKANPRMGGSRFPRSIFTTFFLTSRPWITQTDAKTGMVPGTGTWSTTC